MTWYAVDDSFHGHPKLAELESGPCFAAAVALWTIAGSWCAHHLTDGAVPTAQLRKLVPFDGREAAAELVRVGLWRVAENGYQFHDWDHYQPTRAEVEEKRAKGVARTRKSRALASAGVTDTNGNAACNALQPTSCNADGNASVTPPRPDPVPSRPQSATHSPARAPDANPTDPYKPSQPSPTATRSERLRIGYLDRFSRAFPKVKPPGHAQPMSGGPWLELARELDDSDVDRYLDAFFADDWARKGGCKLGMLLSERVRLLTADIVAAGTTPSLRPVGPERAAWLAAKTRLDADPGDGELAEEVMRLRSVMHNAERARASA